MSDRGWLNLVGCAVACAGFACASAPRAPSAPPPAAAPAASAAARTEPGPEATGLSFTVDPPDAEVLIDGRSAGKVADLSRGAVALQPGLYQVALRRPGYATWRAEVAVRAGFEPIRVTLTRKP